MTKPEKKVKEFVYSQEKGTLHYRDGDEVTRLGSGYSGQPPYVNDAGAQALRARGPIPAGTYRISWPWDHIRLGPISFFLEPDPSNNMFGRSGFFIHGDNSSGNQSASHGCIILSRAVRGKVAERLPQCRTLVVL